MKGSSQKLRDICIYLALALATLSVYWRVGNYDFVNYDDPRYVSENPHVKAGLTWQNIKWAFSTGHASNWHPVTWLSHMLDCELFGQKPGRHHLVNLLFHLANTLLLFWFFNSATGAIWRSGFVAALFALHPLHVESVAWISERKDVLSTLFWMLTMLMYLRYVRRGSFGSYLLSLVFFGLGLMAKPMLVTLPFVLLLLDYWPFERFGLGRQKSVAGGLKWSEFRSLIFEKIPFFVLSGASSTITFIVQRSGGAIKTTDELSFGIRLANAFISYIRYIHKMLWPSRLVMFYPYPEGTLPIRQILGAIVLLCAVTALVLWLGRRHKYLLVGWLWYLGILAPVIGLVQVGNQAMADRYSYVSIIGLFVIVAWLLPTSFATGTCRKFILALSAGIILSVLTVCTGFQIRHWRNSIALFRHALESTDNNYIAHCCIAEPLRQSGYLDGAIFHNKEALRIRPDYLEAHNGLAIALFEKGYPSEAITHFSKALQIDPGFVEARGNLASALARQGRFEEAVSQYRKALELMPDNATIHNGIGVALGKVGQYDQAIFHFRRALQINPDFSDARNNLTYTLSRQRKAR